VPRSRRAAKGPYAVGPEGIIPDSNLAAVERDAKLADQIPLETPPAPPRGDIPVEATPTGKPQTDALPLDTHVSPPDALPVENAAEPHPAAYDLAKENPNALPLVDKETAQAQNVVRGFADFADKSKTVIALFQNADVSTLNHELFHYYRRFGMTDELVKSLETGIGKKAGEPWTRADEEKAATLYERYLADGKAPSPELEPAFAKAKQWFGDIYKDINNSSIAATVSPEVRQSFDQMFGGAKVGEASAAASGTTRLNQAINIDGLRNDLRTGVADGTIKSDADLMDRLKTHINIYRSGATEDAVGTVQQIAKVLDEEIFKEGRGVLSLDKVAEESADILEKLRLAPDGEAFKAIAKDSKASRNLAVNLVAYRGYRDSLSDQLTKLMRENMLSPGNAVKLRREQELLADLAKWTKSVDVLQTNLARGPSFGRVISPTTALDQLKLRNGGPVDMRRLRILASPLNPVTAVRGTTSSRLLKAWRRKGRTHSGVSTTSSGSTPCLVERTRRVRTSSRRPGPLSFNRPSECLAAK
jgi:hypothetical protein